jgi:hypothetical protein
MARMRLMNPLKKSIRGEKRIPESSFLHFFSRQKEM